MIISQKTLNCRGKMIICDTPLVMGIINITSDSFYVGSRVKDTTTLLRQAEKMISEGADILDIGAMSSMPGSKISQPKEEMDKILPAIDLLQSEFPQLIISIDTLHSIVARKSLEYGAHIINDISAGTYDSQMISTVASFDAPYIMMHMQGLPKTMQNHPTYSDIVLDILSFFKERIRIAQSHGIKDIIIDPGFGFGKTIDHNFELLKRLEVFHILNLPILVGVSRKSMIWKTLDITANEALNGTTALNMIALMKGSHILRVHDVKEAKETIHLFQQFKS